MGRRKGNVRVCYGGLEKRVTDRPAVTAQTSKQLVLAGTSMKADPSKVQKPNHKKRVK